VLRRALEAARREHTSPVAQTLLEFLAAAKRGVCTDRSKGATVDEAD